MSSLYDQIIEAIPELENSIEFRNGMIIIQDDSDGLGEYIAEWNSSKKIPKGLKIGK